MLGAEKGSTDIDGEDEGLIDGRILVVGVGDGVLDGSMLVVGTSPSLGFFVADFDTVGNILDFKDGAMDSDGNPLGSVVGVGLSLGPMLDAEEGSKDIDGVDEGLIDGPIL
eukprot:scaffold16096_cov64-Attheya_sp.AAC.2